MIEKERCNGLVRDNQQKDQNRRSRTTDIVFFIPRILLPCHNLALTLPTMHLEPRQFGSKIRVCYARSSSCSLEPLASSRNEERAIEVTQRSDFTQFSLEPQKALYNLFHTYSRTSRHLLTGFDV